VNFQPFKAAIQRQFERMSKHALYRVSVEKNDLWDLYLASFPPGTNEMYRKRTEHDCSCCKQFVRSIGDVVAIIDGRVVSIWDIAPQENVADGFITVAAALAEFARSKPIKNYFLHYEKTVGTEKNFEQVTGGEAKRWDHFHVNLPSMLVVGKDTIPTTLGEMRTAREVFLRACMTITDDAIATVLDLIAQNSL
jgi:hypothetical protein